MIIVKFKHPMPLEWLNQPQFLSIAFESERVSTNELAQLVTSNFDLTPSGIKNLALNETKYFETASHGHFGREKYEFFLGKVCKVFETFTNLQLRFIIKK